MRIMRSLDTVVWTAMAMKRMPNCFDALRALLHEKQSVETVVTLYRV
jgi:hypothetical protein